MNDFDVVSYLVDHGARQVKQDEWVVKCPTCGKEKLSVNPDKGAWHCWVCEQYKTAWDGSRVAVAGAGGLAGLIQLLDGCSKDAAVQILLQGSGYQHVPVDSVEFEYEVKHTSTDNPTIYPPDGWQLIYSILPYMLKRGITLGDVHDFAITWCDRGLYRGRLIFPVFEHQRLVYYQARAMWESDSPDFRKTLNPIKTDGIAGATDVIMNLDLAKKYRRVAMVEGPIDCVKTGVESVATFGKKISAKQVALLIRAGVHGIDLIWDGPTPKEPLGAWPEMIRTGMLLSGLFDVRLVFLPADDPGAYNRAVIKQWRREARSIDSMSQIAAI